MKYRFTGLYLLRHASYKVQPCGNHKHIHIEYTKDTHKRHKEYNKVHIIFINL